MTVLTDGSLSIHHQTVTNSPHRLEVEFRGIKLNGNLGFFYHIFIGTPFGFLASMLMANDHQYLDTKLGRWIAYGRIAVLISLPVWFMAFSVIPKDLSKISIEVLYNAFKFVLLVGVVTVVPTLPIMMLSFFNWRRLGATLIRH